MSFLRILRRFNCIKGNFDFDIFQYLKADHESFKSYIQILGFEL
jgi:hypothetical protein